MFILLVCLLVMNMYCGKRADLIEVLFGVVGWGGLNELCIRWGSYPCSKLQIFVEIAWCSVTHREQRGIICAKMAEPIELLFGTFEMMCEVGPSNQHIGATWQIWSNDCSRWH